MIVDCLDNQVAHECGTLLKFARPEHRLIFYLVWDMQFPLQLGTRCLSLKLEGDPGRGTTCQPGRRPTVLGLMKNKNGVLDISLVTPSAARLPVGVGTGGTAGPGRGWLVDPQDGYVFA